MSCSAQTTSQRGLRRCSRWRRCRKGGGHERRSGCTDGVTGEEVARPVPAGGKAEMGANANREEIVAAAAAGVRVWLRS
jgi:hypothetical protein